jgi:ABC-type nitrate/sulfonate/bicarbonate transport system substrate-binding protein
MNRPGRILPGALIAAAALTACGGPAAPASNTPAAASPSGLRHITMVQAVTAPAYSPVIVAQKAGIFAKHGLQVTIVPLEASSTAAQALVGGSHRHLGSPDQLRFSSLPKVGGKSPL